VEVQARRATSEARHDPGRREELGQKLSNWLDPPLTLASVVLIVLTVIQLTTPLTRPRETILTAAQTAIWVFFAASFGVELGVATDRKRYLRSHWVRAVLVFIPFLGFLRILSVIRFAHFASYVRLFLLSRRTGSPALDILRRRHLGQIALMSVIVVGAAAAIEFLVEPGARGANIESIGDAVWFSAATLTTIGSPLYPVTTGGKVTAILLMLYAVSVFTYFVASLASVLIGHDQSKESEDAARDQGGKLVLSADEAKVVRRILSRAEGEPR
jgi:voltage-gated potassium channel